MRIAMISEHASPLAAIGGVDAGGQNVHVAQLASALAARGNTVHVYTRRDDGSLPDSVTTPDGVVVEHITAGPQHRIPKDDLLPHMAEFAERMQERWTQTNSTPNIVHAHFWMSGVAALHACHSTGIPFVLTYHALGNVKRRMQGAADTSPPERIGWERTIGAASSMIIAQCRDEVQELATYGIPEEKTTLVPSGVDTVRFRPLADMDGDRTRRRILTVGRMVPRKGFADLVRVLARLPETDLVIAGGPPANRLVDDPFAQELWALADELGVTDRVQMLGAVPTRQMPDRYRAADVVACTPAYEPFGLTSLEAMACGRPVIAYAVGGFRDSVIHGHTGMLVPAGDLDELARAFTELFADPQRHARYSVNARNRVVDHYSWPHIAAQVEKAYREVTV